MELLFFDFISAAFSWLPPSLSALVGAFFVILLFLFLTTFVIFFIRIFK